MYNEPNIGLISLDGSLVSFAETKDENDKKEYSINPYIFGTAGMFALANCGILCDLISGLVMSPIFLSNTSIHGHCFKV